MRQLVYPYNPASGVLGYGAAWPESAGGAFAVVRPGQPIAVKGGEVPPLPVGDGIAMYVDVTANGWIIGQAHEGDHVWEWSGGAWTDRGTAWWPHAAVYGPAGEAYILADLAQAHATGGWRYCLTTGHPVGVTATYADPVRGLYEWTDFGDVAIGQGHDSIGEGAVVWFPSDEPEDPEKPDGPKKNDLRRLAFEQLRDHGQLRAIVVKRHGDDFAITVVDQQTCVTTITYATLAELRALPPVQTVPPTEPPTEPTDPPVDPPVDPPTTPPTDPPTTPPTNPPTDPPKPEEPTMIHAYIDAGTDNAVTVFKCEEIDRGDGNFAYRNVLGGETPILAKLPDGGWRWGAEDTIGAPWQTFRKNAAGTALLCDREDHGKWTFFVVPATFVEVKA